jgi:SpoVK/Ycf46/Vps4 family AAA+-type ATPase
MSTARQLIALLKNHVEGDEQEFLSVALQLAAREARLGHQKVAQQIRELVDQARTKGSAIQRRSGSFVVLQPRNELSSLLSVQQPTMRLAGLVLSQAIADRLRRVIVEQRQQNKLSQHGLRPRRKLLFIGPPGTGKTITAAALAGELHVPLFTILLEGVITKFMGETATKLKVVFDSMVVDKGVYLFDEFDALGARRSQTNDVGEIRRILNSFLQLLEKDDSQGLIIAATNHPELLDKALFRRFDDVIEYGIPDRETALKIIQCRLARFKLDINWDRISSEAAGLSQAELVRASDEAAKNAILQEIEIIATENLVSSLQERKRTGSSA